MSHSSRCTLAIMAALACLVLSGCVERRLTFTTAEDYGEVEIELDGHPIGTAPCTVIFYRYGVREWVARSDGKQIASGRVELASPWYQYPPMDLLVETVVPWTIVDEHSVSVVLNSHSPRDEKEMYLRAQEARENAERDLQEARDRRSRVDEGRGNR